MLGIRGSLYIRYASLEIEEKYDIYLKIITLYVYNMWDELHKLKLSF